MVSAGLSRQGKRITACVGLLAMVFWMGWLVCDSLRPVTAPAGAAIASDVAELRTRVSEVETKVRLLARRSESPVVRERIEPKGGKFEDVLENLVRRIGAIEAALESLVPEVAVDLQNVNTVIVDPSSSVQAKVAHWRAAAERSLANVSDYAIKTMLDLAMTHQDSNVRASIWGCPGAVTSPTFRAKLLSHATRDASPMVRVAAVGVLARLREDQDARQELRRMQMEDVSPAVSAAVERVLKGRGQ